MTNADELRDHFHPDHWADLLNSGLTPETIHAHGIYSARPSDIPKLLGWAPTDLASALVFPYPGQNGFCRVKCFPPLTNGNGHTIRYLQKKGSGVRLYIPKVAESVLKNPQTPMNWTEGEKKSLRADQEWIPCIALGGLWNWIEDNSAIEGLDEIAHVNRLEKFYPDHDVWARPDLLKAVYAFAREIEARGGQISIGILPSTPGEQKLDEFLQRYTREDLDALPHINRRHKTFTGFASWWRGWRQTKLTGKRKVKAQTPTYRLRPYRVHEGRIVYLAEKHGLLGTRTLEPVPVADFSARVTEEIVTEEGTRLFTIAGTTIHDHEFQVEIPAADFADDRTLKAALTTAVGARDPVHAGMQKHLAPAISLLTTDALRHIRRYERTGWADGRFLIPGREPEATRITLPRKLPYQISDQADIERGLNALSALILCMYPERTTVVVGIAFQAPLADIAGWRDERCGVFIKGRTGSLKTSWAQGLMSIYGPDFLRDSMLIKLGQGATTNAMMALATRAHDLPFLIDNYKPSTGGGARDLINLVHNILEGGEKDRLKRSAELKETKPIFCWPLITGEDVPDTDPASLARLLVVPFTWEPGEPNKVLAKAQDAAPHLCAVGATWLTWLESEDGQTHVHEERLKFQETRASWAEILRKERPDMVNILRVATNLATNQLTWQIMLAHPRIGPTIQDFSNAHRQGLHLLAKEMGSYTAEALEATRFLATLQELFTSERYLLLAKNEIPAYNSQRDRVLGWKDGDGSFYLLPTLARQAVDRTLGDPGLGGVSDITLHSQLEALGMLQSHDSGRRTKVLRVGTQTKRTLHLKADALQETSEEDKDAAG